MITDILKPGRNKLAFTAWCMNSVDIWECGEEERLLNEAIEYLTKAIGKRPRGFRAPSWDMSPFTSN